MKKLFVLFVALALVGAFTVPVMAAEDEGAVWSFYGNARMGTFFNSKDKDAGDDDDLQWDMFGTSRIGARVKASDSVGGRFEYGVSGKSVGGGHKLARVRLLYGTWNFGAGTLVVGRDYTPLLHSFSSQVGMDDGGLWGSGILYDGRNPQIKLRLGGFQVALINPKTGVLGADGDVDVSVPKIAAKYRFATDVFHVSVAGGYQTYDVDNSTDAGDYSVDSWVVGIGGGASFGPVGIFTNVYIGQNDAQLGNAHYADASASIIGGQVIDNDTLGFTGGVTFKATDMLSFEGGYGYESAELDTSGSNADETSMYYVQASIVVAPGVKIQPEIGIADWHEDGTGADKGSTTYFGARWIISF